MFFYDFEYFISIIYEKCPDDCTDIRSSYDHAGKYTVYQYPYGKVLHDIGNYCEIDDTKRNSDDDDKVY